MEWEFYEYSKGDGELLLEKMRFQMKNIYNNVSCMGKTKVIMDEMNMESVDWVRKNRGDLNIWVHGIFQNYHRFLKSTVDWFRERDTIVVPIGYNYFSSTEKSAKDIAFRINDVMKKAEIDNINLIGVSYGGCVARHYVEYLSGYKKVDKLINVCTPYSGLGKGSVVYWLGKFIGENNDIKDDVFYRNSCENHFAVHALNDKIVGEQDILCSGVKQIFVRGGHNPSSNDPRKLELILKILKGKIS